MEEFDFEPFEQELKGILNKYSVDNQLSTPDFILATHIVSCLRSLEILIDDTDIHKTI